MTYCVGILLDEGLLLAADTRTAAGVDHVASFQIHEAGNFIEVADEDACFGGMRRAFGDGIAALFDTIEAPPVP